MYQTLVVGGLCTCKVVTQGLGRGCASFTLRDTQSVGATARCMGPTQACAALNAAQQKISLGRINPLKADRERSRSRA